MMKGKAGLFLIAALLLLPLLQGCGRPENPIPGLRAALAKEPTYSVILSDMEQKSGFFGDSYYHKYEIITEKGSTVTDWYPVSKAIYMRYANMLGMTILAKDKDGKVTETPFPPGYQYVGNTRYGRWQTDSSGRSFWVFYGQYALLRDLFHLGGRTIYRDDYNSYRRYRSMGRPYYGPHNEYGTNGTYTRRTRPTFFQRRMERERLARESFRQKVKNRIGRSRSGFRSRAGGFGK